MPLSLAHLRLLHVAELPVPQPASLDLNPVLSVFIPGTLASVAEPSSLYLVNESSAPLLNLSDTGCIHSLLAERSQKSGHEMVIWGNLISSF